jgi:glyoxylase-like metal-dependent hydrolase (beta-lactamase superfamily II)
VLFSGDALVTNNIFTGKEGEPQLLHNSINQDPQMAKRSIEKLNTIGEITLYPGHGKLWKGNLAEDLGFAKGVN